MLFLLALADESGSDTVNIGMTQKELGAYIGIGRTAVNLELCKMKQEGIIDYRRYIYTILKREQHPAPVPVL
jgi:biotin operon repressor